MYAVIRIRGGLNINDQTRDTLKMLNLKKVNHCALVNEDPSFKGMLKRVENWITWGEVSKEMEKKLKERGGDSKIIRLSPPSHGFKSTRLHYPKGDLGYRGDKINDLLKRMV